MRNTMLFVSIIVALFVGMPVTIFAHCDTLEGPMIKDAKAALEANDVTSVLKWVSKEREGEAKAAFEQALAERIGEREKAEMRFFETLVKIHREGEGVPFAGLKPAGTPPEPAVVAADEAIEDASVDSLVEEVSAHVAQGIRERFARVMETKKHINESVEAGREYVEAYVTFVHYVEGIHGVAEAHSAHGHGE